MRKRQKITHLIVNKNEFIDILRQYHCSIDFFNFGERYEKALWHNIKNVIVNYWPRVWSRSSKGATSVTCDFHCVLGCISHLSQSGEESVFIRAHVKHTSFFVNFPRTHTPQTTSAGKEEFCHQHLQSKSRARVANSTWIIKWSFWGEIPRSRDRSGMARRPLRCHKGVCGGQLKS